jgi:hypothetical protein
MSSPGREMILMTIREQWENIPEENRVSIYSDTWRKDKSNGDTFMMTFGGLRTLEMYLSQAINHISKLEEDYDFILELLEDRTKEEPGGA